MNSKMAAILVSYSLPSYFHKKKKNFMVWQINRINYYRALMAMTPYYNINIIFLNSNERNLVNRYCFHRKIITFHTNTKDVTEGCFVINSNRSTTNMNPILRLV